MSGLKYDVLNNRRDGVTRGVPEETKALQWVSNTATLIADEQNAVLVDTYMTRSANQELIDWIKAHHINVKYIYLTHAHADHFFGAGMIKAAFPGATIIGTQATADGIPAVMTPGNIAGTWEALFPGNLPSPIVGVDEVVDSAFELDGHRIEIIQNGFTDTHDTTSLWVPELKLIVAGDATYNGIHAYMQETTLHARNNWIKVNEHLKTLHPQFVVAGHKNPENKDDPAIIDQTIQYIIDFNRLAAEATTAEALYAKMLALYPHYLNPGSLWSSAHAVIRQ
ncbi:MAG: MBL fold metallo-hydrolase [Lactobacillus sp.]|jgi:glyoxylase-like metal-dependent hydrolase (beta-lactamase superfamily II)|uniref:MBL fold metallo-hydrolase n=1 Tax=Lacticaseibacillus suilingensis TaxID=2799577 RepID=A0ABW4BFR6_9LACO|nr:MBL fold metallo-hydrolase [Lacticaseibacillus suilingensis]MCI1894257.1 MBL fold metallo-hydrolase [Lactobacillus sp.]MCI1916898.1 MBL fold metallo-hydrolase [Lactobacillus sp.]MCI1942102.1 MBL fold metallo-hydrolase [Lactobacillus sp.]MCI1972435.1 MBL fold metallo-hydrolase [Lactobacillus sp.]MCI2017020.1 MBL fold metallo-hydrolase [Lactobacillus sp.]